MKIEENLFVGKLVKLAAVEPEKAAPLFSRWSRDAEFERLLDSNAPRLFSAATIKTWIEEEMEKEIVNFAFFMIQTLEDDRPIGFIDLGYRNWHTGNAWVGIGIGERDSWGKGYGTDAMRLILRYAFDELNLHRVSLGVFEFNPRAMRSYEKAGFTVEGRERAAIHRDGRRWDVILMGILRSEWEAQQNGSTDT
ncbi:MAG TPA: GNAT family protein [Anaerolineales bacterium]|nr:GNAT family protein [Anaerolineales bacterium]